MKLLIKNTTIVNPEQELNEVSDILIEDGVIKKIGGVTAAEEKECKVIDHEGMVTAPGFFDMHVHLREPGREDKETVKTGCNAAAAGGFTGVACMPNTTPSIDSAETVRFILDKAKGHLVDVSPIGAVTKNREGEALAPMSELYEAGVKAFSDDGTAVKTAFVLKSAFEYASMFDAPIIEHCEDETLADGAMNEGEVSTMLGLPPLPSVSEDLIVMRDIQMAEYTGGKIHIAHISTKGAVELVRAAKAKGVKITAEVTPHHFTLTDEALKMYDTNYKMSPPLRNAEDVAAIIEGLKDGTIDAIASDHAPHTLEEKEREFIYAPNGILGLETMLGLTTNELLHKGHITLERMVELLAINPRKIMNIPVPQIKVGEVANLTVFRKDEIWTVDVKQFKSKSRNSPFDKKLLNGKPALAINKGVMFYEDKFTNI